MFIIYMTIYQKIQNYILTILCLHGYHQNSDIFRHKTGSFRKPLKKYAEFEFLNAPHLLNENRPSTDGRSDDSAYLLKTSTSETPPDGRGWWLKNTKDGESDGFQESLDLLKKTLNENGPFDGVLGFSQGAAFLALACILHGQNLSFSPLNFVILVAGFKSALPAHAEFYHVNSKVNIPSLHVIGDSDQIISSERSRELVELFDDGRIVSHPGGHYVPALRELREVYVNFIEQFVNH